MGEFDWPKVGEFEVAIGVLTLGDANGEKTPQRIATSEP